MNQISSFRGRRALAARRTRRDLPPGPNPLPKLLDGRATSTDEDAEPVRAARRSAGSSEPLMAAAFVALRMKGETAEEMIGAALALSRAAAAFRATRLSLCRQLRHGRRFLRLDQRLDRDGLRRRRLRTSGRQARQPQLHFDVRLGRRARSAGRTDRSRAAEVARDPRPDRLLLPLRAALSSGHEACRPGSPAAQGSHDHEPARPVPEPGAAAGPAARRSPIRTAAADRRDAARAGRRTRRSSFMARASTKSRCMGSRRPSAFGRRDRGDRDHSRAGGPRAHAAAADRGRRRRRRMPRASRRCSSGRGGEADERHRCPERRRAA